MTPIKSTFAPNDLILFATFAAPPGIKVTFSIFATGTGASGEILYTLHHKCSSNIISPITNTFNFLILFNISLILFIISLKYPGK